MYSILGLICHLVWWCYYHCCRFLWFTHWFNVIDISASIIFSSAFQNYIVFVCGFPHSFVSLSSWFSMALSFNYPFKQLYAIYSNWKICSTSSDWGMFSFIKRFLFLREKWTVARNWSRPLNMKKWQTLNAFQEGSFFCAVQFYNPFSFLI